ncbi:hypothetical protein [Bradyrhizobium sp. 2]|uniref:hypothetical protein n=1 Tax=Bradyrhizobium sp. 2 TaxID=190045 RepID=UPI001FF9B088|nr:hypothetical protein [Bradyrhizobium sp. 2]
MMSSDPVQMLIDAGAFPDNSFPPNSRYHGAAIGRLKRSADDPGVAYVLRRFIPRRAASASPANTSSMPASGPTRSPPQRSATPNCIGASPTPMS